MPSLRDYRDRIKSVKSTRKITSAMKMVAASKLRKAQEQAESAQPYAVAIGEMLARVARNVTVNASSPKLLIGTGSEQKQLLVVVTADRGLCGGFNAYIVKDNKIITRPVSNSILSGITRASVLQLAKERDMEIEERTFAIEEAYEADEAFVTAASTFVMPVVEIDGRQVGGGQPGPAVRRLREIYIEHARATAI